MGGIRIAFERVGGTCVWSCDYDTDAQRVYLTNFNEMSAGDIYKIDTEDIPDHDVLLAGFPCPSFSIIGKRKGIDQYSVYDWGKSTKSNRQGRLFFQIIRILRKKRPHAFLLENVKGLSSTRVGDSKIIELMILMLENLGYYVDWKILNALDYGLPQKRERVIMVGFKKNYKFSWPRKLKKIKLLSEILENDDDVDDSFFASKYINEKRIVAVKNKKIFYPSIWHENKSGNVSILPYSTALRANASHNYILVNGRRRLTPREMLRLQGYPEEYTILGTYSAIRKLTGNSVPIPMIEAVAKQMIKSIKEGVLISRMKQVELVEVI